MHRGTHIADGSAHKLLQLFHVHCGSCGWCTHGSLLIKSVDQSQSVIKRLMPLAFLLAVFFGLGFPSFGSLARAFFQLASGGLGGSGGMLGYFVRGFSDLISG